MCRYADDDALTRNYYGCIRALDHQVGRLRRVLQQLGVGNDTVIAFTSDNGMPAAAHWQSPPALLLTLLAV